MKKRSKKLSYGVGVGFDRTDMPASFEVWATVNHSDIPVLKFNTNARKKPVDSRLPRVSFFISIVKADIIINVFTKNQTNDIYLYL